MFVGVLAALWLGPAHAAAQSATLTLSGNPSELSITTAVAGSPPIVVSDNTTTYSLTTAYPAAKITARLETALPAGVTLVVTLQAPSGAIGVGSVTLSTVAQTVMSAIPSGTFNGLMITYRLSATSAAGVVSLASRAVVFDVGSDP